MSEGRVDVGAILKEKKQKEKQAAKQRLASVGRPCFVPSALPSFFRYSLWVEVPWQCFLFCSFWLRPTFRIFTVGNRAY